MSHRADNDVTDVSEFKSITLKRFPTKSKLISNLDNKKWPQQPVNMRVQEIGKEFFEEFERAMKSYKNFNKKCYGQAHSIRKLMLTAEADEVSFNTDEFTLSREDYEDLYTESLYTIQHKIGKTSEGHMKEAKQLNNYTQQAFGITPQQHQQFLKNSIDCKPPVVVLEVLVVEAKDLEAKDANGFSDPYCMLGIVQKSTARAWMNVQRECAKEAKSSSNQRYDYYKDQDNTKATASDMIPAKYIKSTSVKMDCLNPVWNEKFRFELDDVKTDKLHLDVWDRDDDFSVMDSVKKLNEVKGIKGLGRYFKKIAQSARTESDEGVDDFMGTIQISLKDIPSTGLDKWYKLQTRSSKSKVQGEIRLKLKLSTREDKSYSDDNDDELIEVKQHKNLMSVFIQYEYNMAKQTGCVWDGELRVEGKTILHQHAIQGDIEENRQAICWWLAMVFQFCKNVFPLSLILKALENLEAKWSSSDIFREDEASIASSFEHLIHFILRLLDDKIQLECDVAVDLKGIENYLEFMKRIYASPVFERCIPFPTPLKGNITKLFKEIYTSSYNQLRSSKNMSAKEDDLLKRYKHKIRKLIMTLILAKDVYNDIFIRLTGVDVFRVAYKETRLLLNKDLPADLEELLVSREIIDNADYDVDTGLPIFKLFLVIRKFYNMAWFLEESDRSRLDPPTFHQSFKPYLSHWVDQVDEFLTKRLELINKFEKVENVGDKVVQSSLPTDVAYCFGQVVNFWFNLRWPDHQTHVPSQSFAYKFTKIISVGAYEITDMMVQKLKENGYYDQVGQFDLSLELCIAINNMEQVKNAYTSAASTFLQPIQYAAGFQDSDEEYEEKRKQLIEQLIESTQSQLDENIDDVTDKVAAQMRGDLERFVFRLCWSSEAVSHNEAIKSLLSYLDKNFSTVNEFLLKVNMDRILKSVWKQVLICLHSALSNPEELKEAKWIPGRLKKCMKVLWEFFRAEGVGLDDDCLRDSLYEELELRLETLTLTTTQLINNFYKEKLHLQSKWNSEYNGSVTFKAQFSNGLIIVEVLSARNLTPMDTNGLSDPYIILEIGPRYKFPRLKPQSTSVKKKSLNPTWHETFTFDVSGCSLEGACLVLTLMDYDYLSPNDFAGEAYIPVQAISRGSNKPHHPITIPFMQGTELHCVKLICLLKALKMNSSDQIAAEFLKRKADTVLRPT